MTSHTRWVDTSHPACFIFLIDQSDSMRHPWKSDATDQIASKAAGVASIVNSTLNLLLGKSDPSFDGVKHYFDIAVIGYGKSVGSALPGELAQSSLVSGPELEAVGQLEVIDGIRTVVWVKPKASHRTPMAEALAKAWRLAEGWAQVHQDCYPPVVLNFTDGDATDHEYGDPRKCAEELRKVKTEDGNLLLFNINVSGVAAETIKFPSERDALPNDYARLLFDMSSELPESMMQAIDDLNVAAGARAFVLNADVATTLEALDIGTRVEAR